VDVEIKRYQTSSLAFPEQGAAAIPELVAFATVPEVLLHPVEEVNRIAPPQLLLTG
jgi:hypothetical protein